MSRTRVSVCFWILPRQWEALKRLSKNTRVSQSEYLREALDDLLRKRTFEVDHSNLDEEVTS
jgi:Arc/MetJ-type ribon-helix-helix transcriptional regulator